MADDARMPDPDDPTAPRGESPTDDDGRPRRPVPDPLDRVWRHPSEMARSSPSRRFSRFAHRNLRRRRPPPRSDAERAARARLRNAVLVPVGSALAGAGVTLALLGAFGSVRFERSDANDTVSASTTPEPEAMVGRLAPSIVAVMATDTDGHRRGSGVALRHRGEIVTSARLVGAAATVTVLTVAGERLRADVIDLDAAADLALLDIHRPITAAPIATTGIGVGESVYAIGADPSGHATPWVTRGIIASTDGLVARTPGPQMAGLIVTDALVDTHAAGGALVDAKGGVLGILLSPVEGRREGLALPISFAAEITRRLRTNGDADHGWLGLHGIDTAEGPIVGEVIRHGPADRAGVRFGDLILSVDGRSVRSMAEVTAVVRRHWPREVVELRVRRGKSDLETFTITIGAARPAAADDTTPATSPDAAVPIAVGAGR
jgi:S1-C subfamily serine protease